MTLKEARIAAGMTIAELAAAAGVSPAAISRYETGKREMRRRIAHRISGILSVPWYEIAEADHDDKLPDHQ